MTEEFTASQLNEFASNIKLSKEKEHVYTLMRKAAEAAKDNGKKEGRSQSFIL